MYYVHKKKGEVSSALPDLASLMSAHSKSNRDIAYEEWLSEQWEFRTGDKKDFDALTDTDKRQWYENDHDYAVKRCNEQQTDTSVQHALACRDKCITKCKEPKFSSTVSGSNSVFSKGKEQ